MEQFLEATEIIDWNHPLVSSKASELSTGLTRTEDVARRCFEWVRDEIQHSSDFLIAGNLSITLRAPGEGKSR